MCHRYLSEAGRAFAAFLGSPPNGLLLGDRAHACYLRKVRKPPGDFGAVPDQKIWTKCFFLFFPCNPLKSHETAKEILGESKLFFGDSKHFLGDSKHFLGDSLETAWGRLARPARRPKAGGFRGRGRDDNVRVRRPARGPPGVARNGVRRAKTSYRRPRLSRRPRSVKTG